MADKPSPLQVRIPNEIRSQLKELAAHNRRSMNSEIAFQLERALSEETLTKKADAPRA